MGGLSEGMEKKLEKLDNAFLFAIGLVGLLFTIVQTLKNGKIGLIEISPLLILGIVVPFYVGYVRGAIEYNSTIERIRGWVYFAIGVISYFAFSLESFGVSMDVGLWLYFILVSFGILSVRFLEKWFSKFFNLKRRNSNFYSFYGTAVAGVALAFSSRIAIIIFGELYPNFQYSSSLILEIFVTYVVLLSALAIEKISRQVINADLSFLGEQSTQLRKARFWQRASISILALFSLLTFVLYAKKRVYFALTFILALSGSILEASVYKIPVLPDAMVVASMVSFSLLLIPFFQTEKIDFGKIEEFIRNQEKRMANRESQSLSN
jgi:hypothetical protein